MNRQLSSEAFRNRADFSTTGRMFHLLHDREKVITALSRIAEDLTQRTITLGDLWNNEGKRAYLDRLQNEGVLPDEDTQIVQYNQNRRTVRRSQRQPSARPPQLTFIPNDAQHIQWTATQQRTRAVWEELQSLLMTQYPNAIAALMRILVELAGEDYIAKYQLQADDRLLSEVGKVSSSCSNVASYRERILMS